MGNDTQETTWGFIATMFDNGMPALCLLWALPAFWLYHWLISTLHVPDYERIAALEFELGLSDTPPQATPLRYGDHTVNGQMIPIWTGDSEAAHGE